MPQPSLANSFTTKFHRKPYPAIDPTLPASSASGKTIIITAARRLEVLTATAKELSASNPQTKFHVFAASITDHDAIKNIFEQIRSTIAQPNILVTSAAYTAPFATTLELSSQELRASFETNVMGDSNLVREFLATSTSKENIVIDISTFATYLYLSDLSAYSITKLAFTQWMAHLHEELGGKGVRIHSVHPGTAYTDAVRKVGATEDTGKWDDVQISGQFVVWLASPAGEFLKE